MSGTIQTLLKAVEGALQRIRKVDGFHTDAGALVTLEPAPRLAEGSQEFIAVVWERQERAADPALVNTHRLTTFNVLAKVPVEIDDAQGMLGLMVADIEAAMVDQRSRYPVGYQFPRYRSAEPVVPQQITTGWIGVNVTYTSHIPIRPRAA